MPTDGLHQLEAYLRRLGVAETYRGDPYGQGRDWVYFACYFDPEAVRQRFELGPDIQYYEYDGRMAGQESGFSDPASGFGVMGEHPRYGQAHRARLITGSELPAPTAAP